VAVNKRLHTACRCDPKTPDPPALIREDPQN
jgi:hypothetical protein